MNFLKYIIILLFLSGCKSQIDMIQKVDVDINSEKINLSVFYNGEKISNEDLNINPILSLDTLKNNFPQDTFYDISYNKWIFRVRKKYLTTEGDNIIEFDKRLFGNSLRKRFPSGIPTRSYYILDVGEDDLHLLPVIKN